MKSEEKNNKGKKITLLAFTIYIVLLLSSCAASGVNEASYNALLSKAASLEAAGKQANAKVASLEEAVATLENVSREYEQYKQNNTTPASAEAVIDTTTAPMTTTAPTTTTPTTIAPTTAAPKRQDLEIGEIVNCGSFSAGVSDVRSLDYIQTHAEQESVPETQEVIYVFLDVRNDSDELKTVRNSNLSIYRDSLLVADTGIDGIVELDGYTEDIWYYLEPSTHAVVLRGFVIDKGWKSISVFYDDASWLIHPEDLSIEGDKDKCLFPFDATPMITAEGTEIYSTEYSIIYDGFTIYTWHEKFQYAVFMFTVTNTSNETLDYHMTGYKMRAYHNYRLLDSVNYVVHDTIDDHTNIFDVDDIKPGMSAKIYVLFDIDEENNTGVYTCTYDVGFGGNEVLGIVNAESK